MRLVPATQKREHKIEVSENLRTGCNSDYERTAVGMWTRIATRPLPGPGNRSAATRKRTRRSLPAFFLQPRDLPLLPPNGRGRGRLQRGIKFAESQLQHCRAESRKEGLELKSSLITGTVIIRRTILVYPL